MWTTAPVWHFLSTVTDLHATLKRHVNQDSQQRPKPSASQGESHPHLAPYRWGASWLPLPRIWISLPPSVQAVCLPKRRCYSGSTTPHSVPSTVPLYPQSGSGVLLPGSTKPRPSPVFPSWAAEQFDRTSLRKGRQKAWENEKKVCRLHHTLNAWVLSALQYIHAVLYWWYLWENPKLKNKLIW